MSKLLKQIWENYGDWISSLTIGLVLAIVFPNSSIGWICLNLVLFHLICAISIVPHELGHAIATYCVGMQVTEITIGSGKTIFEFQLFGTPWKIKQVPVGGMTYILMTSTHFYRLRMFVIALFGPLANFSLICLALQFPTNFIVAHLPGIYIFPGIVFCISNAILVIINLSPKYLNIDGVRVPNDGLLMLTAPFISTKEIGAEVARSWLTNGERWERRGNYPKAIASFSKAIQYDPGDFRAYQSNGNAYRSIKDDRLAIDNYQQAIDRLSYSIKLEHRNPDYYYSRANVYYDWRKLDPAKSIKAIEDLTVAIDIDPHQQYFYYLRAAIYCYSACEAKAIEDFTKIIHLAPDANAYYNRGVTYYQAKDYRAAIEDLTVAIDLDGNNSSSYYNRGNAKYKLQYKLGAFEDYNLAKVASSNEDIISKDEHNFYARGIADIWLGNKIGAIDNFERAVALCLEYGNTSLLQRSRAELAQITSSDR